MFRLKKGFLFILGFSIMLFSFPMLSSAHATVVRTNPSDNQVLAHSPKMVSIEFDEAIQPTFYSVKVYDTNGNQINRDDQLINHGKKLKANFNQKLSDGVYTIKWRAVSDDGHPVEGLIPFQVGGEKNTALLKSKTQGYVPHLDLVFLRWIQYICGAIFVGLAFFYIAIFPKDQLQNTSIFSRYKKIINLSFVLFTLSILMGLPLEATIEAGVSWQGAFRLPILKDVITQTLFGTIWTLDVILLFLLLFTLKRNKHLFFWWASFILGTFILFTKAITGHAITTKDFLISIEFDFLHLFSASVWIGSLVALVILLPLYKKAESKDQYSQMVRKFSKWGIVCVLALGLSGIYISTQYIPTIHSLFSTPYGRVLIGKVILFLIMLILAYINNKKEKNWGLSLWGEVITGLVVLVLAVLLTNLPTAYSSLGPFNQINKLTNQGSVQLKVNPNIAGENDFKVILKDKQGKPLNQVQQVTLTFTFQQMDMGDDTIIVPKKQNGFYTVKGLYFTMPGQWKVHVHVLTKSKETLDSDFKCIVGR